LRDASIRATPTATPLTVAQATASPIEVSGWAGFIGGFLPVASFHVVVSALRAAMPPMRVAPSA
jgi:hypothetical protein